MILTMSRTPMRISFVGGATDIQNYYSQFGGEVVSCAINRYIYVTINRRDDNLIVVSYGKTEKVPDVERIEHPIVREALKMAGIKKGIEIHIIANISTIGTGLGGSSAVAVGLLRVLFPEKSQREIAEMACDLEINKMGKCIGKQDQYACALGKLNYLKFDKNGLVTSCNYEVPNFSYSILKDKMYLVKVRNNRISAETLLQKQTGLDNTNYLHAIKILCYPFVNALNSNSTNQISELINTYWSLKKKLSNDITNSAIDTIIDEYQAKGCGAKLCGAGQSGYVFVFDPSKQCKGIPVEIDYQGTIISYI